MSLELAKNSGKEKCTQFVKTPAKSGETKSDHRCGRAQFADGFCRTHHPKLIQERLDEQQKRQDEYQMRKDEARDRRVSLENEAKPSIEAAIVLLVNSGYRVEKVLKSGND